MSGDIINICRVCETTQDLKVIFHQKSCDLVEKLMLCADVQVDADDQLPKFICLKCSERLDLAYEFKIQCESTDAKFRRLLLRNELKKCKVEEIEEPTGIVVDTGEEFDEFCLDDFGDVEELIEVEGVEFNEDGEEDPIENTVYIEEAQESHDSHMEISIEGDENFLLVEEETCIEDKEQSGLEESFVVDDDSNAEVLAEANEEEGTYSVDIKQKKVKGNMVEKLFACDTCGAQFNTFVEINQHKKAHGDKRYQCPVCTKWFSKKYRLKNHMRTHEGLKTFTCEMCGNKYTNQGNLDRHIRHFHKNERPYMCNQCGLSFSRSNILKLHLIVHIKERNFECDVCNKRFKAEYYLKLHKKSHIPIEERPQTTRKTRQGKKPKSFTCSYCGKVLTSKAVHDIHVRTHTGEKPFECTTCHRRFAFKQSLKSHELLHTGEKPFSCELCGLSFRQVGHLKGHMLVHSGLKNHKCKYCEKPFALKSNLIVHQRLHTGETPYHCSLCDKKFYDSNGLKRHKKCHSKEQAEVDLNELVKIEPITDFLDENSKEYSEIIEMEANGELRIVTLNEEKQILLCKEESF